MQDAEKRPFVKISRQAFRRLASAIYITLLAAFVFLAHAPMAQAQARINDKDMASMMRNVRDDARSFRSSFDAAVRHSTIRKTSQAKDAKRLVATFEKQTKYMLERFKQHHRGGAELRGVLDTAQQIDTLVYSVQFGPEVTAKWQKIREELHPIAASYDVPENYGRRDRDRGTGSD
jgi:uncharacterized membrane protein YgaE (UPF0421/DUF939 family)